jgi:hypothetical protein
MRILPARIIAKANSQWPKFAFGAIASARAADDEGIRCKMDVFLISYYKFDPYKINISLL